jgi:hypothetical protein
VLDPQFGERVQRAFARGAGHGLLRLGAAEVEAVVPPVFAYRREFAGRFVTGLCARPDVDERQLELPTPSEDLKPLAAAAPVMPGAEYLTADVLISLWAEIGAAFLVELAEAKVTVQEFLKSLHPAWNVVGKVHFNLAENRKDEEAPFAFLATYAHQLSVHGKAQHLPLGQALRDYAGAPAVIEIPLLVGESVNTADIRNEESHGTVSLNLAATQDQVTWTSTLAESSVIDLHMDAKNASHWSEVWRMQVAPIWHTTMSGILPVRRDSAENSRIPGVAPLAGRIRAHCGRTTEWRAGPHVDHRCQCVGSRPWSA